MPTLITEPAVDYGIAMAALFFHSSYSEKKALQAFRVLWEQQP